MGRKVHILSEAEDVLKKLPANKKQVLIDCAEHWNDPTKCLFDPADAAVDLKLPLRCTQYQRNLYVIHPSFGKMKTKQCASIILRVADPKIETQNRVPVGVLPDDTVDENGVETWGSVKGEMAGLCLGVVTYMDYKCWIKQKDNFDKEILTGSRRGITFSVGTKTYSLPERSKNYNFGEIIAACK